MVFLILPQASSGGSRITSMLCGATLHIFIRGLSPQSLPTLRTCKKRLSLPPPNPRHYASVITSSIHRERTVTADFY